MIEATQLSKVYRSADGDIPALRDVSFSVDQGEFVSIIGPSGCGKSTLLKILGDIIEPSSGSITVDGLSAREAREKGMFSFVFQNPVLLPWRRVIDNLRLPLEILHREARDPTRLLEMVGLAGCENLYPRELSGGMQQRAALARALTFDPKIMLMDEPFGAADELTRNTLNHELLRIWQEASVTILFITHSIPEAIFLADRVFLLSARPATLEYVLDVSLPRPREDVMKESETFQDMVRCLREKLH